jgi:hypothetical protein
MYDNSGKFQTTFGRAGVADGQFLAPQGITLDTHGNVFVVDTIVGRVVQFALVPEPSTFVTVVAGGFFVLLYRLSGTRHSAAGDL